MQNKLMNMFNLMLDRFGPQHWWPGNGPFEMMTGAILTQNTSWTNVEKALANLKRESLLSVKAINDISSEKLAEFIRPAGYFNIKSKRLKNLVSLLADDYNGDLSRFVNEDIETQRMALLSVKGIGPETADSIILYASKKPVFVIDTYTYRILSRHNLVDEQVTYDDLQDIFMNNLEPDHGLFNEFHALLVRTAKEYCKKHPKCDNCPLNVWESDGSSFLSSL
ncbi:MAG: endonuclease III domain-containing protein [Deltaproteobacteria bacterium]|nr:endonuclease III domain-containing protein [Deltaproteobacteria bacterium]